MWIVGLSLAAVAAGCVSNHYELEITPDGQSLQRRVVAWRPGSSSDPNQAGDIDQDELDRIALAYGKQAPRAGSQKFEFQGQFERRTPADIGGSGSLTEWVSSLGRASMYVERFRGNDDLAAALDARREAAEELADVLIAWFHVELGDGDAFTRVRQVFDGPLRQDLRNVAAYSCVAMAIEDAAAAETYHFEMLARFGQYLVERGYLTPDDLPEIVRAVEQSDQARVCVFLRRVLLAKLGLPPQETSWDFLSDPGRVQESLNESLREDAHYRQYCARHETDIPPAEYVSELGLRTVGFELFAGFDMLDVKLRCPSPPYRTNGVWSADQSAVLWSRRIPEFGKATLRPLPPLLFAFWSVPDAAFQTAHFGKVVLSDERLARYCTWYKGLTAGESAEWDEFVLKLEAGESLLQQLGQFRFRGDPPPTPENESPPSLADAARELILAGLEGQ